MRIFTRVKWLTTKLLDKYLKNLPAGPNFYLHHCNNKFLHHTAGQEETSLSQEVLSGFLLGIRTNLKINLLVFLQTKNRSGVISWPVMPCHFGHNLTGLWGAPALRWCRSPLDWLSWAKGDVLQGRSCSRKGTVLPGSPALPSPLHTPLGSEEVRNRSWDHILHRFTSSISFHRKIFLPNGLSKTKAT